MKRFGALLMCAAALAGCSTKVEDKSALPGVEALVFVKRAYVTDKGTHEVSSGVGQVFDYDRYVPGKDAGLFVLTPPAPDGKLVNLTSAFKGVDINGVDISFDAKKVVFSMRTSADNRYHIFTASVNGSSKVKQLTFHDADDTQPVFLAGGRVAFVTNQPFTEMGTRADEYEHARAVTQLATISEVGGDSDRRLCAQNLSHTTGPFAMKNGLVGFSRWEHLGPTNDLKMFTMRPDCTQMRALAGQHNKDFNSIVQVREVGTGEFVGVATTREGTIQAGALMHVNVPYRKINAEIGAFDEQKASFENLTLNVPTSMDAPPSGEGRYRSPNVLPGSSKLIVSWADGDVNERNDLAGTAPNFGLYLYDPASGKRELVYDDPNYWDLYALPVSVRDEPPVIGAATQGAYDLTKPATIGSINVRSTSLDEQITGAQLDGMQLSDALKQAQRVRVIEGFSSEIGPVGQFGLTMFEGGAILGEAKVHDDGSWLAKIPPYIPVHLQPIDRFDLSIRNQLLWIQGMPNESRVCGGCHEDRAGNIESTTTQAQQAVENFVKPIQERTEFPWFKAAVGGNVQDVLDAKCANCHSGGAGDPFAGMKYTVHVTKKDGTMEQFDIPYLDLSSKPLHVFYEMEDVTYPASYVTIMYPSAMMGGEGIRVENAPEEWVIPGNARASRFIKKMNINAVKWEGQKLTETDEWAFAGSKGHPEDKGVTLTREERLTLIRAIDLGGQYYSRRNIEGGPFTGETYKP